MNAFLDILDECSLNVGTIYKKNIYKILINARRRIVRSMDNVTKSLKFAIEEKMAFHGVLASYFILDFEEDGSVMVYCEKYTKL